MQHKSARVGQSYRLHLFFFFLDIQEYLFSLELNLGESLQLESIL